MPSSTLSPLTAGRLPYLATSHHSCRWTNITGTNINCTPELGDYPLIGRDLNSPKDAPDDSSPCIVTALCAINPNLLPPPTDTDTWRKYVAGPPPAEDWLLLRPIKSLAWWSYTTFTRPMLGFVVGRLTGTAMFQQPLTIDAETKLLRRISKVLSLGLGSQKDIVLRDRWVWPGLQSMGVESGRLQVEGWLCDPFAIKGSAY